MISIQEFIENIIVVKGKNIFKASEKLDEKEIQVIDELTKEVITSKLYPDALINEEIVMTEKEVLLYNTMYICEASNLIKEVLISKLNNKKVWWI